VFPTGKSAEVIELDRSTSVEVTILDIDNPMVILEASALGLRGHELPDSLNTKRDLLALAERIRGHAAARLGLADDVRNARLQSPGPPRVIILSPPMDHGLVSGPPVSAGQCDMLARMTSDGVFHHALAGAALTALAVAAQIDGTVAHKIAPADTSQVRIAHPKGVVPVSAVVDGEIVQSITLPRTARRLMRGTVFMPSG
jgi:2-methylaconitate cis-trans-isomerase PrpF